MTYTENKNNTDSCGQLGAVSKNALFLLIGAVIGATAALLFAPKPGEELRKELRNTLQNKYRQALETAGELNDKAAEVYQTAQEKGGEILSTISTSALELGEEFRSNIEKSGQSIHH
jgi:gas vesicle protein